MKLKELLAITNKKLNMWIKTKKETIIFGNPIEIRNKLKIRNKLYLLYKIKSIDKQYNNLIITIEEEKEK